MPIGAGACELQIGVAFWTARAADVLTIWMKTVNRDW